MDKTQLLESVIKKFGIAPQDLLGLLSKKLEQKHKKQRTVDILIDEN